MNTAREHRRGAHLPGGVGVPGWLWFLGSAALVVGAYYVLPSFGVGRTTQSAVYTAFSAGTAVTIVLATLRHRPAGRTGWLLLAAGQLAYTVADGLYAANAAAQSPVAAPIAADVWYLLQYPLIVVALITFIRRRTPGWRTASVIDAAIVATGFGLVGWVYLIGPLTTAPDLTPLARLVAVAYPVGDLLVLAVGLRLALGTGGRTPAFRLMLGSLILMLFSDTVYAVQTTSGTYADFSWLDSGWLIAYALLGAAALHPSMRWIDERSAVAAPDATRGRLTLLATASLLAPTVLLIEYWRGRVDNVPVIAVACTVLFLLVQARMAGLVTAQRRVASTDALTGLSTRGYFTDRLASLRAGGPAGVLLIDVDRFKVVNDTYGHPAGDAVLAEVARRLRAMCRPDDVVARYGGEEFALLVPAADRPHLARLAERARRAIAGEPVDIDDGTRIRVSISIGTASMPGAAATPEELIKVADRALYAAKRSGRNAVVNAAPSGLAAVLAGPGQPGTHDRPGQPGTHDRPGQPGTHDRPGPPGTGDRADATAGR